LLRLTGSAASWSASLVAGLQVHAGRMRANLDAAGGLLLAEHVAARLAPAVGVRAAHDMVAVAAASAAAQRISLPAALLADPAAESALSAAGISRDDLAAVMEPSSYLGSAAEFVRRALAAHARFATAEPSLPRKEPLASD
jgi:3-carboxy-cis,cis-muconate cycloisomerase